MGIKTPMRFHLPALPMLPIHPRYSACAFVWTIRNLSTLLTNLGHKVYVYGVEGSDVNCAKFIPVLTEAEVKAVYGNYDEYGTKQEFRSDTNDDLHQRFSLRTINAINLNKLRGDILLASYGITAERIAKETGLPTVEPSIGYEGCFAPYRVFASYAWMHYIYGKEQRLFPSWGDAVIPHCFDPTYLPFQAEKQDYFLHLGRIGYQKGTRLVVEFAERLGIKVVIAGQFPQEGDPNAVSINHPNIEYVGVVGYEKRAQLMQNARALLCPSHYVEPFGQVAVEAQFCGTPVICTDWGAYSETVKHGETGFRCHSWQDFVVAIQRVKDLDPQVCRDWAMHSYSLEVVAPMYQEYFERIQDLQSPEGWYSLHNTPSGS